VFALEIGKDAQTPGPTEKRLGLFFVVPPSFGFNRRRR
jgi:hypothetical protein